MMQSYKRILIIFLGTILNTAVFAANLPFTPVFSLTVGDAMAQPGTTQTITDTGPYTYNYIPNSSTDSQTRILGGAFIGVALPFAGVSPWSVQTGLAYYQIAPFTASGDLQQGYGPSSYDNYSYHYHISSQQLVEETKLLGDGYGRYHPYFLVDVGAAFNNVNDYQAVTSQTSADISPLYSGHHNTAFSYGAGLGLDVDVINHLRAGFGYRLADLGTANSGTGSKTYGSYYVGAFPYNLKQSHLYVQTIVAQLSYLL